MKKRHKLIKTSLSGIGIVVLFLAGLVGYLTITEYNPADVEEEMVVGKGKKNLTKEKEITIVSYNIGYGCNGEEADFFMDGGKMVRAKSKEDVEKNLNGMISILDEIHADVMFLQEIDIDSKRAYGINEVQTVADYFSEIANYSFAYNYLCKYVPYPFPETVGRGILLTPDCR